MLKVTRLRKVYRQVILSMKEKKNSRGFTLIEVMAVVIILGILFAIAVFSVTGIIEKTKQEVCYANVKELERHYEVYLTIEDIAHSNVVFAQYLQDYGEDICPVGGEIGYMDGEVRCSVHSIDEKEHDDVDEDVPFL